MDVHVLGGTLTVDETLFEGGEELAETVREQAAEYERGDRRSFDIPLTIPDTFTGNVMRAMQAIPYGETRTYGDLAAELDTAPIAVGGACGRNPIPLLVPCHRVVASDGSLRGFSAEGGVAFKQRLLDHEARVAGGQA